MTTIENGPPNHLTSTLAVDLGKTACRIVLWRGAASFAADGRGAPGLADPNGTGLAEAAIMAIAMPLLREAGLSRLDAVAVGTAGAWSAPDAARRLAQRLATRLMAANVAVASDAITSHAGALGGQPGIVLSVGTGTVAVAVGPHGSVHRIDGLGPWLGDEGGGAAIGLAGLRAACCASERRGPATDLVAAAEAQFGPLAALPARLTADPNPARLAATFAPAVIQTALAGDPVARGLIDAAAAALIATLRAARQHLPADRPFPVALVGGLAATPSLTHPLLAALPTLALTLIATPGSALDGARWLATTHTTLFDAHVHRVTKTDTATTDTLDQLATETVRPGLEDLDQRSPAVIVSLSLAAERAAQDALALAAPALGALADAVAARMAQGGRLFYLGAGTPGRLAMLDAAELAPTYSAPPGQVVALLAGGPSAMIQAAEGAEDDAAAAAAALDDHGLTAGDAVIGIAASGRTPFVVGGLIHARSRGALTGAIVNNPGSPAAAAADIAVEILTGPEIVAGSTRMTAGTTQKIALNALSTACMIALGKTYGSRMVDVRASNTKLRRRALRTVCEVAACSETEAAAALASVGGRVKPALVMLLAGIDAATAERRLEAAGGHIRRAMTDHVRQDLA